MQSTSDREEVEHRIGLLQSLNADLGLGGPRVWMRLDSNLKHDTKFKDYPTFEQVIGVEAGDMATAFGKSSTAWRSLFKEQKKMSVGFIHGRHTNCVFISVASTEDRAEEDARDLSPTTGLKMDKEMMMKVKSKLKALRKLSNLPSRPKKRKKAADDSNISTGTPAEPATTSTSTKEPQSSKDGAPMHETCRKRKAQGEATQISPSTGCKDSSSVDKTSIAEVAAALRIELNMEEVQREVMAALERHFVTASVSIPHDADKERLACDVLTELVSKTKNGTAELTSKTIDGRQKTRKFTVLPERRGKPNPKSTKKSQSEWVRNKVSTLSHFTDALLYADTPHERALARRVIGKVAQKYDGQVLRVDSKFETFSMTESNYIRDKIHASSSAMVELGATINALRPDLLSVYDIRLFPPCFASKWAAYEGSFNLEVKHVKVQLQVNKDETSTKLRSHAYLVTPWVLLQMMVENSLLDNSFQASETWMNEDYASKIVVTYNVDKGGNDIINSIRLTIEREDRTVKTCIALK
ncbi:hypothetical protein THAOC_15486 [Thalassiosira oceanica]|uniref:Uncharacterized protein n=1 Tax=Thalassiosira oceanica TaxID=159749 RepID=K0SS09_THAOC|nr:hypothetical protein THAOC_15486 [Thalassiosira oceanica]|eukprot:EJK63836.1 hypothetical protein THAOC_15486 [Thalassiosira oceanica]